MKIRLICIPTLVRRPFDKGDEYIYERPDLIEAYVDKPITNEAKLDKIAGKVDLDDWKDGKKQHRKRLKLGIICRGPGCNCKTKFGNKTRLRDHYIEMGCYSCKRPGCMIRLGCPNCAKSRCL